ncbi:hypothetical protein [Methylibium sp.]|uniref:hypothetical protein n=1 Tax=Methylibium sp. TaxID=2067992 RepID=UPI0017E442D5|nr:hypothetical protein [Methylibium sp.]MBA3590812.1 hypothetical protein [Methylibium sp.]
MDKPKCFNFWAVFWYGFITHFYLFVFVVLPMLIYLAGQSSAWGLGLGASAGVAAFVAAMAVFGAVSGARDDNCGWEGCDARCWAGIVANAVPSFNTAADFWLPWNAAHDRVDVVLKSVYWPSLRFRPGSDLYAQCNDDVLQSPLVYCFYRSSKVCGAGLGATVGAGIGVPVGVLAALLIVTAIGCASIVFCLFLVVLAALIAATIVLIGAFAGGHIGKSMAPEDHEGASAQPVSVGDYVSLTGKVSGVDSAGNEQRPFRHFGPTKIMFFVESTSLHGRSLWPVPYMYVDPDLNLAQDACPVAPSEAEPPAPPRIK